MIFKHIDLKNLTEIVENELTTLKHFVNLSIITISDSLQKLDAAYSIKDFEKIHFFSHKLKTSINLLNINEIVNEIKFIEITANETTDIQLIKPSYEKVHFVLSESIKELKEYINSTEHNG